MCFVASAQGFQAPEVTGYAFLLLKRNDMAAHIEHTCNHTGIYISCVCKSQLSIYNIFHSTSKQTLPIKLGDTFRYIVSLMNLKIPTIA